MDRTICAKERSRREGFSASHSHAPTDALPFRGRCVQRATRSRAEGAITAGGVVAVAVPGVSGRSPLGWSTVPRVGGVSEEPDGGVSEEPDVFSLHENLWPGGIPRTPATTFRAPQGGRPLWSVPRERVWTPTARLPPATPPSRPRTAMCALPYGQPVGLVGLRRLEAAQIPPRPESPARPRPVWTRRRKTLLWQGLASRHGCASPERQSVHRPPSV